MSPQDVAAMMKTYSVPYNVDKSGMSALHVAACIVIYELIDERPDIFDLLNERGQTALHAAVAGGHVSAVKYMMMIMHRIGYVTNINLADENGNTALHLASIYRNGEIINLLMKDPKVHISDITAINKELSTADGIYLCNNSGEQENLGCSVGPPLFQQLNHDYWKVKSTDNKETIRRHESRLLTATLIATVIFAAGFTVPGGTRSDGKAVLNGSMYYKTFSLFNWFSFLASAVVIYNEILEKTVLPVRVVAWLIQLSIGGMVVALAAGYSALQTGFRKPTTSETMQFIFLTVGVPLFFLLLPKYLGFVKRKWKQTFRYSPAARTIN